jgi:hypothetical protein
MRKVSPKENRVVIKKASPTYSIAMKILAFTLALAFIIGMAVMPYGEPDAEPAGIADGDVSVDVTTGIEPTDFAFGDNDIAKSSENNEPGEDTVDGDDYDFDEKNAVNDSDYDVNDAGEFGVDAIGFAQASMEISLFSLPTDPVPFVCPNFEAAVREQLSIPTGQVITRGDVEGVDTLLLDGREITDLSGIDFFVALTTLNVHFNQLSTLNVSKNPALEVLRARNNQLTTIDVSNNHRQQPTNNTRCE